MGSTINIAIAMSIVDVDVYPMGSFSTVPFKMPYINVQGSDSPRSTSTVFSTSTVILL